MRLSILTYNVHGLPWITCPIETIANWSLRHSGAEILCFQEVWTSRLRAVLKKKAEEIGWSAHFPKETRWLGSGLAILSHPKFTLAEPTEFRPYTISHGVDSFATKGYFTASFLVPGKGKIINVMNTHLQSDLTDCVCFRVNYENSRALQEIELYHGATRKQLPFLIGDMNMPHFDWFSLIDRESHVTFPETEEHLDHAIILERDAAKIRHKKTTYFDDILWSDHIPVVYDVEIV
jgi:exonuclease III